MGSLPSPVHHNTSIQCSTHCLRFGGSHQKHKRCIFCFIFGSYFLILLFQGDKFVIDGLEAVLKLLYLGLVGIKERDEREFVLMENGMDVDGSIKLHILISWFYLELIVQGSQLVSKAIA